MTGTKFILSIRGPAEDPGRRPGGESAPCAGWAGAEILNEGEGSSTVAQADTLVGGRTMTRVGIGRALALAAILGSVVSGAFLQPAVAAGAAGQSGGGSTGAFTITQTLVNPRFGNRVVTVSGFLSSDYVVATPGPSSGTFPAGPFNELQITSYSIEGAQLDAPTHSGDFTPTRQYKGRLTGTALTVSGTTSELYGNCNTDYGSFKIRLDVSVTVNGVTQEYHSPEPCTQPAGTPKYVVKQGAGRFSVSVPITPAGSVAQPRPVSPPPATAAKPTDTAGAIAGGVEDVINSLRDSCFSRFRVARLGDVGTFRSALATKLKIETGTTGKLMTRLQGSNGSHWGIHGDPTASMYLPFDPATTKLTDKNKVTLWHELTHHLEWLHGNHGDPRFSMKGFQERNTAYMERVAEALSMWKNYEAQFADGRRSPDVASDRTMWESFKRRMRELERGQATSNEKGAEGQWWPPDARLEAWTGFRVKFEEIRELYRSGACGEALRKLVEGP